MRRSLLLATACAAALVAALGLQTAPAHAVPTSRVTFVGEIAYGEWSTCPTWRLGDRCVFTQVIAADSRSHEGNDFLDPTQHGAFLRTAGPSVVLRHYWFTVVRLDGELFPWLTKESLGVVGTPAFPATPADTVVRVDTRLRSGTASTTALRMHTTLDDDPEGTDYWEDATVSTRWTGTGPVSRVREGSITWNESQRQRSATTGFERDVRAVGTSSLLRSWGTFVGGYLFHGTQVEASSWKGPTAGTVSQALTEARTGAVLSTPLRERSRATSTFGEAYWTTCPDPKAGDRCRDTSVWFFDITSTAGDADLYRGTEVLDYTVLSVEDGWVEWELVAAVSGSGPLGGLSLGHALSGAVLAAETVQADLCLPDAECVPVPMTFGASWTATGAAKRFAGHAVQWGYWGREWAHYAGTTVDATATATFSGLPSYLGMNGAVSGTLRSATLSSSNERHFLKLR